MTVTYTEADDCLVDNLVKLNEITEHRRPMNSKSNMLNSMDITPELQQFFNKVHNKRDLVIKSIIETTDTDAFSTPNYIDNLKQEEVPCNFFDSLNSQLNIVFLIVPFVYFFVAFCLICIYCKYKGAKGEYERLKSENDEAAQISLAKSTILFFNSYRK